MKIIYKGCNIISIFESDEEIKEFIKLLKEMKKSKVSIQRYYGRKRSKDFSLHNGKPSIPDYNSGYVRSELLRGSH